MAKVMISLPDAMLERIDAEAGRRGVSRSALLREAAQREIGHRDPAAMQAALDRARGLFADAPPFDSAQVIRADRDARDARDRGRL